MGFHDDSWLIVVHSRQERTCDRSEKAVLELGRVLPEVPDVAFQVLSKEITGILRKYAVGVHRIMHLDTCNTINDSGLVSHGKDVFDRSVRSKIGKGGARNQWEVRIIYCRGEVSRIDDWIVGARAKLLTTRLSYLESSSAGIKRISQIGCGLPLARSPRCGVGDVNAFAKRNLIVTLRR